MAERIVSPGVFTNEIDESFLPAAISDIGAALIGTCKKGPAFVPTVVNSYTDFQLKFGGLDKNHYLPYTAKSYLKSSGTAVIVRVLGKKGYTATNAVVISKAASAGAAMPHTGAMAFGLNYTGSTAVGYDIKITGSDGNVYTFEPVVSASNLGITPGEVNDDYVVYFDIGMGPVAAGGGSDLGGGPVSQSVGNLAGAINSASIGVDAKSSGSTAGTVWALSLTSSLLQPFTNAANESIGRGIQTGSSAIFFPHNASTLFSSLNNDGGYIMGGGKESPNQIPIAVIFPTGSGAEANNNLTSTVLAGTCKYNNDFVLDWKGTGDLSPTMSLYTSDGNYISTVLGEGARPTVAGTQQYPGYVHSIFKNTGDSLAADTELNLSTATTAIGVSDGYANGQTPWIVSQQTNGATTDLFKLETLSSGNHSNRELKVSIAGIKPAGTVAGSDWAHFDIIIRKFSDTDKRPVVLEQFAAVNFDPESTNFIKRRIGDQQDTVNTAVSPPKIETTGEYSVRSKYVRISNLNPAIDAGGLGRGVVPFGFGNYYANFNTAGATPDAPFRTNQQDGAETNTKLYHGLDFDSGSNSEGGLAKNLIPYLDVKPDTVGAIATSSAFGLDKDCSLTTGSAISSLKFTLGFQGGTDGFDERYWGGTNSNGEFHGLGHWMYGSPNNDSGSHNDAIDLVANPDEIDINMLVLPGTDKIGTPKIYSKALTAVEDRADTFFVFDTGDETKTIADVISADGVQTVDSNYAATYYPWVQIFDDENAKQVWVPPSVVVPGVIAFTDKVAHPWFAPAGLNRGGLTEVIRAKDRLTHSNRDDLYDNRVNPIATFPGEGVCVWGQKTLQAKPSALDRVNVRRLLIKLKKFIASSSRYLVFEQNNQATRNRFLNIVNPFLEQVQSQSGLSAFRVVMDDSNNTPDVVDRNELRGQIFIQPTRTAEFIVLDFIVQPTGAVFPE